MINKINGYNEESNGNKYLTILPSYEGKYILGKHEEVWTKIKDLIKSKFIMIKTNKMIMMKKK